MTEPQQYSLRWNNYFRQLTYALDNHRENDEFVDVSLLCDGRKIRAHKVVLSACSSYFKEIFTENPHPHPLIIFKFIKYEDLNSIIKFMYQGEVNVLQEGLQSFLQTAELLSVHGLNTDDKDKTKSHTTVMSDQNLIKSIPSTSSVRAVNVASLVTQNADIPQSIGADQNSVSITSTHKIASHQVITATGHAQNPQQLLAQEQDQQQARGQQDKWNTQLPMITTNKVTAPVASCSNVSKKRKATFSDDDDISCTPETLGEQAVAESDGMTFRETIRMDIPEYILGVVNDPLLDTGGTLRNTQDSSSEQIITQIKSEYEILTESEIEEKYQHEDNAEITIEKRLLLNPSSSAVQVASEDASGSNVGLTGNKGKTTVSTSLRIRTIFQLWLEIKQNRPCDVMHHVKDFVEKHFKRVLLESEQQKIKLTLLKFSNNWSKYHRIRDRFETELSDWLDSELFCEIICNEASTSRIGRPNVSYEEGSMRTKRRRVEELVASTSSEALKKAAESYGSDSC